MIIVEIHKDASGNYRSISASDHSGYAEEGSDIICAGVSTLVYTAVGALQEMCGLDDFYRIVEGSDEDTIPFSEIMLPGGLTPEQNRTAQTILKTIAIGLEQLADSVGQDYGNQFLRVTEIADHK